MRWLPNLCALGHPRSLSSEIERVMMEHGDMQIFHGPFSYMYYVVEGHSVLHLAPDHEDPQLTKM